MALEPFTLRGEHVELIPLALDHVDALTRAARGDRATYRFTEVPADAVAMSDYVTRMLSSARDGTALPFAQRRVRDGTLVGCTRFMELRWWRGREEPDEAEIGGTWLTADAQRTPINTEAKLLLLTHAFDRWGVVRVALATDSRNARSRTAIERIGARYEGTLRHHRPSTVEGEAGRPRDTALFALTDEDWPAARESLERRLRSPTVGD
jgi:N-acetyltransferase